ncbi:hypothetical protein LXL04_021974 [Taraxacum kok-saghyz]
MVRVKIWVNNLDYGSTYNKRTDFQHPVMINRLHQQRSTHVICLELAIVTMAISIVADLVTLCPTCKRRMNVVLQVVGSPAVKEAKVKLSGGYVKEVVTYMVMDDLAVKPMSTISSITLINSFGVKDLSRLEEKILHIGKDEALKLLKASLSTSEVLTTLFRQTNVA